MKIELDEKEIEIILLAHIRKLFPGDWECNLDHSYSHIKAKFTLKVMPIVAMDLFEEK